jgi:primosomal protein N' (replication factor Y)
MAVFGTGIQKVAEETGKLFPKFKLFQIDSDIVKNSREGREIAEKFSNTPGSILIGTEMLFSYFNQPVERVAVISVDGLFSLPDFRIHEKIFHVLLKLRALAKKTFLVQTRLSSPVYNQLFEDAFKGNISEFYKTEIENRRQLQYPPFKTLIKVTRESKDKLGVKKELDIVKKLLNEWNPVVYPAFIPKVKNIYTWNVLLRIDPEKKFALPNIPSEWKIDVDPETLL